MNELLVRIDQIGKSFDAQQPPALENINATISKGEIVGIAGPDGAGKTTLIRLMAALLLPTAGSITINEFDTVKNPEKISEMIGYMPQRFGLYEDLTVMQNLNLYADLKGVKPSDKKPIFERLLHFTGLAPFTKRAAKYLSGGMKQKLGLACALLSKPVLLLLDEPSVGVDPISRRELWKMVKELLEEDITVVWSTSYLDEAERCDSVILLNEGKMIYQGPPKELTSRVEGRVFKISSIPNNKRQMLQTILSDDSVEDGSIQGSDLRILIKKDHAAPRIEKPMHIFPAPPRFEDAFMDILGGGPKGFSILAENSPKIENPNPIAVEAKGLTKKFGTFTAADNITFQVPRGEIFGLLGPNGAGKSTTFKMLCGLLTPTSGSARVNNVDLQEAPSKARAQIGYMAQKFSLYGNLSVHQNLEFFSGIYNLHGQERAKQVELMIRIFNFSEFLNENAGALPLGYKQRLALSCSVMHHPGVLFLDEPTSGVDPITRREFWNHINGLVEKGITVVVTTHFMEEAEYCDRIGLVYRSKLIRVGTPDELKKAAVTEEHTNPTLEDAFIYLINQSDEAYV